MSYELVDFEKDVLEKSRQVPVLVDFWAPWCGPCKALTPVIEKLAGEANGKWALVKINTEEHPDLAQAYGIRSIPNVKLFVEGSVKDEFFGALPEPEIRRWLKKHLPSPNDQNITQAKALLGGKDFGGAAALLEAALSAEPENTEARLLLAQAYVTLDPKRVEEIIGRLGSDLELADRANAWKSLARIAALADQPELLPDDNCKGSFLKGAQSIKRADYASAFEAFIEVLQRKRNYHDGGAKEACKAMFQALGVRHPICDQYYRSVTSVLHS